MICPRCGVVNASERDSCTRCSGSLLPPSARDDRPLPPVLPVTKRAELRAGLGSVAAPASAGTGAGGHPSGPTPAPPGAAIDSAAIGSAAIDPAAIDPTSGDLYLLSTERSTGQPAPPAAPLSQSESLAADRPGRLAVGLSRA
jgi:hypothetical protein